jgi:hypothetical protein
MVVTVGGARVGVDEADDCTRLHVAAPGADAEGVAAALGRAGLGGPKDAGHVWLDVEGLRALARAAATAPDWDGRFTAMIDYARSKGWLDAAGERVAAHVVTG